MNYYLSQKNLVSNQDCDQVSEQDKPQDILHAVLDFCITEKSKQEICSFIGYRNLTYFTRKYLNPLLASGQLKMTIPDKPNSRKQKYITVRTEWNKKQDIGFHPYRPASYLFLISTKCLKFGKKKPLQTSVYKGFECSDYYLFGKWD